MNCRKTFCTITALMLFAGLTPVLAQNPSMGHYYNGYYYQSADGSFSTGKFEQLDQILPTPNTYRTASGAPGHQYWQQRADYIINAELNDENQRITASETITYTNNSPDVLTYLWVQLDQNHFAKTSDTYSTATGSIQQGGGRFGTSSIDAMKRLMFPETFDGGYKITAVKDGLGKPLKYTINKTMMRIELPVPLRQGQQFSFAIDWNFNIVPSSTNARSSREFFQKDGNYLYEIAQWFPRMAVYSDYQGWLHKQFLGGGEFTLPFGNYKVNLTVPADHIVAATGTLQNPDAVLTPEQRERFKKATNSADAPVMIVTLDEAKKNEGKSERSKQKKTWSFVAENVRDFAFASSRKFQWDAMSVTIPETGKKVMAMSYYPKEGSPLWDQYSTRAVAHTLRVYSKFTIPYPYPVAISVNGPVGGMEYPMICFNGPRPEADGTYQPRVKYGLISVVIHEVGHNFFPMIINSDERQWAWMDEGLNSFTQYLAEVEWDRNYPARRGPARNMVDYMKADKNVQNPIMTNSEQVMQLGNNAYGKPATALNILRETVMGRELFDYAYKEYSRRWAFKHPTPADFFRTMEDASGVDLDWFWRGWFYGTDACDIALESVSRLTLDTQNPDVEMAKRKAEKAAEPPEIGKIRNAKDIAKTFVERDTAARDYYDKTDPFAIQPWDKERYERYMASLNDEEKKLLATGVHFYELSFRNLGGLVMPVILELNYEDGTKEVRRIPAEIWRLNNSKASKVVMAPKPVANFTLDPYLETADVDISNNSFPLSLPPSRFQVFKQQNQPAPNPIRLQKEFEERAKAGTSKGTK